MTPQEVEQKQSADARLVAAAPDLLEICQEILTFMVSDDDYGGPAMRLRRAVSKATGDEE